MTETVPFTEAKAHLSELVERVRAERDRIVLTRNGRPVAVLLSPDDLEGLEETIQILQDRELMESIRRSRTEADEGKLLPLRDHV